MSYSEVILLVTFHTVGRDITKVDSFSAGVCMYYCLLGKLPFQSVENLRRCAKFKYVYSFTV